LKELIRSRNAVEGFYENEMLKKELKLWRPIKLGDQLEEIFRKLMSKIYSKLGYKRKMVIFRYLQTTDHGFSQ
jgi:hypothetical protein